MTEQVAAAAGGEDFTAVQASGEFPLPLRTLLDAGVHFGHQTKRWNPKMRQYIYGARNGIHIIDLDQTTRLFTRAYNFISDVVGKGDPDVEVATAFLVAGPFDDVLNEDPVAKANIRAAALDDVVTAAGGAFLGLTINCARCHNHKFDPIPTEDYYRLRAAFEGVTHGRRMVATAAERERYAEQTDGLQKQIKELEAQRGKLDALLQERAAKAFELLSFPRPKVDPGLTEDSFEPKEARFVRMTIFAHTEDAGGKKGKEFGRLTEFEIWTAEDTPRNVALASAGGHAVGPRSTSDEDFLEAYGPQFMIDGQIGEQYFIGSPPVLTITLAGVERIGRVGFTNAFAAGDRPKGGFPCEYRLDVSVDGEHWTTVATGDDRQPWSRSHGIERMKRELTSPAEREEFAAIDRVLKELRNKLRQVPPLREVWAGVFRQPKEPTYVHRGGDQPGRPLQPVGARSGVEGLQPAARRAGGRTAAAAGGVDRVA